MNIQPQYLPLRKLLQGRLFKIPEYQRAYSCGSRQREDLFGEIRKLRDANCDRTHVMATIVGLRPGKNDIVARVMETARAFSEHRRSRKTKQASRKSRS